MYDPAGLYVASYSYIIYSIFIFAEKKLHYKFFADYIT